MWYAAAGGLLAAVTSFWAIHNIHSKHKGSRRSKLVAVEKIFGVLAIFTACAVAFAHGSNDIANAIGPLSAVISVEDAHGLFKEKAFVPPWVLFVGVAGIVLGLSTFGYRVIKTIGTKITQLTPSSGFSAELATAATIVLASGIGLPISTTQTLVGAVLGVGMARGIGALNMGVVRNILMSWVITLPVGAGLAIIFFHIILYSFTGQFSVAL
jgi:PiT family inorganic phosphate transporter